MNNQQPTGLSNVTSHISHPCYSAPRWEAKLLQFVGRFSDRISKTSSKASTQAARYAYRSLQHNSSQFRLLRPIKRWKAYSKSDPLQFKLVTAQLDQDHDYYAVSYAWGEEPGIAEVVLDGTICSLSASAENALRGLLKAMHRADLDSSLLVWIDSLCIDQQNLAEKSAQVAKMGTIFSRAQCVLLWLGEDDGTTTQAIDLLHILSDEALEYTTGEPLIHYYRHKLPAAELAELPYYNIPLPPHDWSILESLICCRPFTRLWCLQEIVLAKNLAPFRGQCYIPWSLLSLAVKWFEHRANVQHWRTFRNSLQTGCAMENIMGMSRFRWSRRRRGIKYFDEALVFVFTLQTSNQWDKVYGLVGLFTTDHTGGCPTPPFAIDYNKPLKEVYAEAFSLALEHGTCPLLFTSCQSMLPLEDETSADWPSWVPRFHLASTETILQVAPSTCLQVPGDHKIKAHAHNPDILQAEGLVVDEINAIYPPPFNKDAHDDSLLTPDRYPDTFRHFTYLWGDEFSAKSKITWSRSSLRSLCLAMIDDACFGTELELPEVVETIFGNFRLFLSQVRTFCTGPVNQALADALDSCKNDTLDHKIQGLAVLNLNARIFPLTISKEDKIGTAPRHVIQGDKIVLLQGTTQPFLMREDGDCWKMRGTCYFPDITDPGFIQELKESGRYEKENRIFDIN